ncbi:MAG: hypothetical protein GY869_18020, partial [Planctomycetes bacterium]|nr:hypothetical protein [Planctomycetota bacterium]
MMKRWLLFVVLVLAAAPFAHAADEFIQNGRWNTGDEASWTRWDIETGGSWDPFWNVTNTGPTEPEGNCVNYDGEGSLGWYQVCRADLGEFVQLNADWAGTVKYGGWAQIFLFEIPAKFEENDVLKIIDTGHPENIAYSRVYSAASGIQTWNWQSAANTPLPEGNQGQLYTETGFVVVALKIGSDSDGSANVSWDNISLMQADPGPSTKTITYQGRLGDTGNPANGQYDMQFTLYGFPLGEYTELSPTITKDEVNVIDGYFTVQLEFAEVEPDIFNGESRWLEIGVRHGELADPNVFTIITPRHEITMTPYTLYALNADTLDGLDASDFIGTSTDFGRYNVATNLYEGIIPLVNKYLQPSNDFGRSGVSADLYEGTTPLSNKYTQFTNDYGRAGVAVNLYEGNTALQNKYQQLGADYGRPGVSPTLYEGAVSIASKYVNETGDAMTGTLNIDTGSTYGLYSLGDDYGVYGRATNTSVNQTYGAYFSTPSVLGHGVFARATNTAGTTSYGGKFESEGTTGRGVYGHATNNSGTDSYGGYFKSDGSTGIGVYAEALNGGWAPNYNGVYGGYFVADGQYSAGLYAKHESTGNYARLADHGIAVTGFWTNGTNNNFGWMGTPDYGLYGTASTASSKGVYGLSSGLNGYGGYFYGSGSNCIGVYARGTQYSAKFVGNVLICGTDTLPVLELGEGLDYAEGFDVTDHEQELIESGCVLIIDPDNPGKLALSTKAYDTKVAGIVAGANGLGSGVRLGIGQFDHDVALAGRVYCYVDATENGIVPGDLLTTSATPGHAMKAVDPDQSRGAILGKAMQ